MIGNCFFSETHSLSSYQNDWESNVLLKWQRWVDSVAIEMEEGNFSRAVELLQREIPPEDYSYALHGLSGAVVEIIVDWQKVLLALAYEKNGQHDLALEQANLVSGSIHEADDHVLAYLKGDSIDLDAFRNILDQESFVKMWLSRNLEDLPDFLEMIHDQTEAVEEAVL